MTKSVPSNSVQQNLLPARVESKKQSPTTSSPKPSSGLSRYASHYGNPHEQYIPEQAGQRVKAAVEFVGTREAESSHKRKCPPYTAANFNSTGSLPKELSCNPDVISSAYITTIPPHITASIYTNQDQAKELPLCSSYANRHAGGNLEFCNSRSKHRNNGVFSRSLSMKSMQSSTEVHTQEFWRPHNYAIASINGALACETRCSKRSVQENTGGQFTTNTEYATLTRRRTMHAELHYSKQSKSCPFPVHQVPINNTGRSSLVSRIRQAENSEYEPFRQTFTTSMKEPVAACANPKSILKISTLLIDESLSKSHQDKELKKVQNTGLGTPTASIAVDKREVSTADSIPMQSVTDDTVFSELEVPVTMSEFLYENAKKVDDLDSKNSMTLSEFLLESRIGTQTVAKNDFSIISMTTFIEEIS